MLIERPFIQLCQGQNSEHIGAIGDGKSGKTWFVREMLLKLPPAYKVWAYDYNHNGFNGIGKPVRSIDALIDGSVQYLPQVKDRKEMDAFVERALALGNRVVVLDEYHTQQHAKYISPLQARFLRTFRHVNGSWIVIAQSPLDLHEAVYNNMDHIFAFMMSPLNRHIKWYKDKFGRMMTAQLIAAFPVAKQKKFPRPYIYKAKDNPMPSLVTPYQKPPALTDKQVDEILRD